MNKFKKIRKQYEEARATMRKEGEKALKEAFKELFATFPEIESIVWAQYAPYFNDGDPCTFDVHEAEVRLNTKKLRDELVEFVPPSEEPEDDNDNFEYAGDEYAYGENDHLIILESSKAKLLKHEKDMISAWRELSEFTKLEDVLEYTFGSDSLVTATRDGFEISEFSHD